MPETAKDSTRRMRGFEPASGLLRETIRVAGETRGFAVSRLLTHWPEVVGEDLAALARPVKVAYGKGGLGATLTLLTTGASAPVLQMRLPEVRARVNACYGYNAISRIQITQTAAQGFAEPVAQYRPAPPPPSARFEALGIGDPGLREALEALGRNVISRAATSGPGQAKGKDA
jgi:hypothetical protein